MSILSWESFITLVLSMLPIVEKGAIPFAIGVLGLPPLQAAFVAIIGNLISVVILLKFLDPVTKFLMKHSKVLNAYLTKLFEKTRHKHSLRFNEVGAIFLILFVAVPSPVTGPWTGSLIAFLFGVKFWHALLLIGIGVVGACTLFALGFESITSIMNWIQS